jgi:hypothetical protein
MKWLALGLAVALAVALGALAELTGRMEDMGGRLLHR